MNDEDLKRDPAVPCELRAESRQPVLALFEPHAGVPIAVTVT